MTANQAPRGDGHRNHLPTTAPTAQPGRRPALLAAAAMTLALLATAAGAAAADPTALNKLAGLRGAGAEFGTGVRETTGRSGGTALAFSGEGGVVLPMGGRLTGRSGGIDLWIKLPAAWPAEQETALLHIGETAHTHVTLFFRNGVLTAPYKPDEANYLALNAPRSQRWAPGSWHRVALTWRPLGERDVALTLRVDDETVGTGTNLAIAQWPARMHLGQRGPSRHPWRGAIEIVSLSPEPLPVPELQGQRHEIAIDTRRVEGVCHNFWSIANTTSQTPFTDAAYRETFRQQRPFARMVNCVRLLGGRSDGEQEWFRGVDAAGRPLCDFTGMIAALRGIREAGYTPRIVLDNVPTAMSAPGPMHTYGNTRPPLDYDLYHAYIRAATEAMIGAFGRATVGAWRFRVMTEPDLNPGHWAGTKEEWLRLYDTAVDAVTQLLPEADIGPGNILNPAQASGKATAEEGRGSTKWGLEIIDHCAGGRNYRTGATGTRMRHFSCSWYGRVGSPISGFEQAIQQIRERLGRYPQFRDLPVEVAEFSALTDERGRRLVANDASEWGGSFFAAIADRAWRLDVRQIHQWAVSSMGLPTPWTHVMGMLERMTGGERLAVGPANAAQGDESGVAACRRGDSLLILVYHHRPAREPKVVNRFVLKLDGLAAGRWARTDLVTDADHGMFLRELYRDCEAAGLKPNDKEPLFNGNPAGRYGRAAVREVFPRQREKYARLAAIALVPAGEVTVGAEGVATIEFAAPAHSVRLIELRPGR